MRALGRWNVFAPLVWQAAAAQPWLVQKSARKFKVTIQSKLPLIFQLTLPSPFSSNSRRLQKCSRLTRRYRCAHRMNCDEARLHCSRWLSRTAMPRPCCSGQSCLCHAAVAANSIWWKVERLAAAESWSPPARHFEIPRQTARRSAIDTIIDTSGTVKWKFSITANANTNDRSRSPTSALLSWPNCTSAPRNRLIFKSRWLSCANAEFGRIPATEVCIDGGGVPLSVGDILLCRLTLELLRSLGGIIELIELMWCGDIGDLGATTRAPSGESGVLFSLPAFEIISIH